MDSGLLHIESFSAALGGASVQADSWECQSRGRAAHHAMNMPRVLHLIYVRRGMSAKLCAHIRKISAMAES